MAGTIYKTVRGDTWDGMAYKFYGAEKYMKLLIEANWPLLDYLVFPSGIEITVPELTEEDEDDMDAPIWRQSDDAIEDYLTALEDEDEDYE